MTFFTFDFFIQLVTSFITAVAFAVIFRINKRHLIHVGIGGALTYAIYYTVLYFMSSLFVAAFISTMATALYAEIFARIRRAPAVVFLLPGIIPTVPGGSLYRGMRDLLLRDLSGAADNLVATVEVGIGIAGGIVTVSIVFGIVLDMIANYKKRSQ